MTKRSSKRSSRRGVARNAPRLSTMSPEEVLNATRKAWSDTLTFDDAEPPPSSKQLAEAIWLDKKGNWKPGHVLMTPETGLLPNFVEDLELNNGEMWRTAEERLRRLLSNRDVYFEHLNGAISYVVVPGWEDQGWYTVEGQYVPPLSTIPQGKRRRR